MDLIAILETTKKHHNLSNSTTNTTAERLNFFDEQRKLAVTYIVLATVATISGVLGNILIIGAIFINKKLRTMGNMFIVNLSIADLWVSGFVNPFGITGVVIGEQWFEERPYVCEIVASICLTSCYASLQNIGVISINRYIAICHHKHYQKIFTKRNTVLMAIAVWVVAFLMEMPNFFGWGDHVYDLKTRTCLWDRTADRSYSHFFAFGGVFTPIFIISIFYLRIFIFVRKKRRQVTTEKSGSNHQNSVHKRQTKLACTLFIIFVVFTSCWGPYATIIVLDANDSFPLEWHMFSILIGHINSSLNVLLYGLTNAEFRRGYWQLVEMVLRKCRCMKAHTKTQSSVDQKQHIHTRLDGTTVSCRTEEKPT